MTVDGVYKVRKNFNVKLFTDEYKSGLTPEQIASQHHLDEALTLVMNRRCFAFDYSSM